MSRYMGPGLAVATRDERLAPVDERTQAFDELIASDALYVAFQPIVDLAHGDPFGYEVLGRVAAIEGALAACAGPAPLLDAAHRCGRLLALDRRWRAIAIESIAEGRDDAYFFLNVDPRVVDDESYASGFTQRLVQKHGLDPSRFVLELTEAPSLDPAAIERVLCSYQAQGFGVAIDDLGAPLQSLSTLLRVRPGFVKLDRAVASGIDRDELRQHLLCSLVDFARRAGMKLIVEGIENEDELRTVVEAGVELAQGFFLGRPEAKLLRPVPRVALALRDARGRRAGTAARGIERDLLPLVQLVEDVAKTTVLEPVLQHVAGFAAGFLGVERISIRLLDESRTRLLVSARSGPPVHASGKEPFRVGEGLVGWVVAEQRALCTGSAAGDPRFAPKAGLSAPFSSFLGVPLLDEEGCIGVIGTTDAEPEAFTSDDERRLQLVAAIVTPHLQLARLHRLLVTDPLTCVWNRRALDELLPEAASVLSVAAVDIDHFKAVNDAHGHAAGDEVLKRLARVLVTTIRESDHVVRTGGEEFVLVLPGASLDDAAAVAERARLAVHGCAAPDGATLSVSIGVATRHPDESRDALLARADTALYRAKAAGRDRVVVVRERDTP